MTLKLLADENVHSDIVKGIRKAACEILYVPEIGLAGRDDQMILEYSEKHGLILISGDKDFGGLIEFGTLWGRGKVILLRYRLININRIVKDVLEVLSNETESLESQSSLVIVLSESGYRIHRHKGN